MEKTSFLIKLSRQGKLQLVDPSEEIKEAYLRKSESSLISAKILYENNRLEESVSMAYYGMYHMLTALMFKTGIKCENHTASISILKDVFGIDNSSISYAKRERVDKQYYIDFKITKDDVGDSIKMAEEFRQILYDFISKMANKSLQEYRGSLKKILLEEGYDK